MTQPGAYPLWDDRVPLPEPGQVPDLDRMTHIVVHRAVAGDYQFLHEASVAVHDGELIVAFANDPVDENSAEGIVRARRSSDLGLTWSAPEVVACGAEGDLGRLCDNHPVLHVHQGRLYCYVSRWPGGPSDDLSWRPLPGMRAVQFLFNPDSGTWKETGVSIDRFLLMQGPQRLPGGGWVIAGEFGFGEPAVAICPDDTMIEWRTYPIATVRRLAFPEPTIIVEPDRLVAVIRNGFLLGPPQTNALVSESFDQGRTWGEAVVSNLPLVASKPFGGILSTGQRYLICNYPDPHSRRGNLVIAVSAPDSDMLSGMRTIRQGVPPLRMAGSCKEPQWSYPYAVEHGGALRVAYSISKEDCAMSVIDLSVLDFHA